MSILHRETGLQRWASLWTCKSSRLTCALQTEDIDLSGNRYNLLGTIFYIAYILSQYVALQSRHEITHSKFKRADLDLNTGGRAWAGSSSHHTSGALSASSSGASSPPSKPQLSTGAA